MRVFQTSDGDPSAHSIPLEPCCAWNRVWVTVAQPGTEIGVVAFCCWVFFGEEAVESLEAGACKKSEDVFSGLPGWEKSMFGGEMDEGANFGS